MNRTKKIILSVILLLSIVLSGFPDVGVVLAEETSSVTMSVNGASETKEYASLMDAIHAIEAMGAENQDNENNTYEIYLESAQYSVDKDYVMPKAKKISFVGKNTSLGGGYYQISHIVLDGDVTFQSDLEMSNINFVGLNDASLTGKDFFGSELCRFGNDFYPVTSVNFNNFYGFSYDTYTRLKAKNYNNLDELAQDFDVKNLGVKQLYFYGALNADTVTCATNAVFFRGQNVTSHIGSYTYICSEQNIWQQDGILFSTMPPMSYEDYISVDIKDVLIKYAKTSRLYWYMGTMKHEKTGISVENISVDSATTSAENVSLEITMGEYSYTGSFQPDCNLDITGQISGIDRITCVYNLMGFDPEDGKDWRELMKEQWGATSFKALTVSQPQNEELKFDSCLSFPNGSGGVWSMNIEKKDSEYWMDFSKPLYELIKLDGYIEKDGIYYEVGDGYASPKYYVGDSETLTIPAYVNIDGTENCVLQSYHYSIPFSLKTNVKKIVLPEDTTNVPRINAPVGSNNNRVNSMLEGGNDNSALERFEIAGENINYSTDEDGNLYNANKSILYCCPPAKTGYTFPDTVTKIGDNAFMGSHIKKLQIPTQIEIVGTNAFSSMKQLEEIEFKGTNVIDFRGYTFENVDLNKLLVKSNGNAVVDNEVLLYSLKNSEGSNSEGNGGDEAPGGGDVIPGIGLKGDVNHDGVVNLLDAKMSLRGSLGIEEINSYQESVGDVDGNGKVNLVDTMFILKRALSIITSFEGLDGKNNIDETNGKDDEKDNKNDGKDDKNDVDNQIAFCEKNGHSYNVVNAATFDEEGLKQCSHCGEQLVIGKKNKAYLLTFIAKEATEYEDGYQIITDEDTGYYTEEIIMHLGHSEELK